MEKLSEFIDVAMSYFSFSIHRDDKIMAAFSDVKADIAALSAKVDAKLAADAAALAASHDAVAAAAAQKVADDAATATELDGVVSDIAAVAAKVS